jgi:Fe-Mn family superoxide dismutase
MKNYSLPKLDYGYKDLEPLYSAEMLEIHHSKHHSAYVDGANAVLDKLREARASSDYDALNQLQKSLAFNVSGHVMHSLFWRCMSPEGGGDPAAGVAKRLDQDFGSVTAVREQMTSAATSLQGSGWVALSWEPMAQGLIIEQVYDHQGNTGSATMPVLVIDCWEHAYYLQYKNEKARWLKSFWDLVDWTGVEARLRDCENIKIAA